ncbi:MAG: hypothetical protein IPN84_17900 [Sphingomonadales bacterium]|nr:hypothetical protein [Sphingomonadales bacterium]
MFLLEGSLADLVLFGVVEAAQTDRVPVGRLEADPSVGSETDMGAFDWLVSCIRVLSSDDASPMRDGQGHSR